MKEYHKINSIFKRDEKGHFISEFSCPEFGYLKDNVWVGTEKIDGTNIRIGYDSNNIKIGGRTDNAQIPTFLLSKLNELFMVEKFKTIYPDLENMILYGEGFGVKIQKGGSNYIKDGVDFILFDVMIGDWYLKREDVEDVANQLGIKVVPIIFKGTLFDAIEMCQLGFRSTFGDFIAEGLVLRPEIELFSRNKQRIITKVKCKDFR